MKEEKEREYYLLRENEKIGPLKKEQLKENGLETGSLIWHIGMEDWQQAAEVAELADLLRTLPPEPPRPEAPRFWMKRSILSTTLCVPVGIIGLINSIKAEEYYHKGLYELAERRAADARKWSLWGLFIFTALTMMTVTAVVLLVAFNIFLV